MSNLHGSWIVKPAGNYFFIWGENWRPVSPSEAADLSDSVPSHPFNLKLEELLAFLKSHNIPLSIDNKSRHHSEIITLPSQRLSRTKKLIPYLASQISGEAKKSKENSLLLQRWQVQGLRLTPLEAVGLLNKLPLNILPDSTNYIGNDLRFWAHVYRWILDLLARGKFVAGVVRQSDSILQSYWHPLLDSIIDRNRFAKFSRMMPPACRAYDGGSEANQTPERQFSKPSELLLEFLSEILDTQLRYWLRSFSLPTRASWVHRWLQSLSQKTSHLKAEESVLKILETALYNWTFSLQENLAYPNNKKLDKNQFRACLSLQPPTDRHRDESWRLHYGLQALDDPGFLIDAKVICWHPGEELYFQNRTVKKPQETLLKGLGLAAQIYPPIADSLQDNFPLYCELNPVEAYEFIKSLAWQLQDNGLGVILPLSLASGAEEKRLGIKIQASVTPKPGQRLSLKTLLDYELNIAIGGRTIAKKEFEKLLEQRSPLVELGGQWLALQPADVRAAKAILDCSHEPLNLSVEDALRLSIGEAKTLAKLPVVDFEASGVLQELIDNLTGDRGIEPMESIFGFRGELRPYQAKGVGWLAFLEKWGLGACLADDMGLGKTPQLIAFLLHLKSEEMLAKSTLVVCPTSVLTNWEREVKKFAPTLSTAIHHGEKRSKGKDFIESIQTVDLVITSYNLVQRDGKLLEQVPWQGVVLDEAQNIKNPQAKQSQAVRKLKADFRIALTGTPVENRLSELWSILDFLNPGFLGTQQFFQRRFATPIERYGDRESLQILRSLTRPFILRRLKTDRTIVQDLPEKQEMNVFCGLSLEQAQLYQQVVDEYLSQIEGSAGIRRRGLILGLLLKLKQICNHPAQFLKEKTLGSPGRSGKLLRLKEMLEELVEEGDRALIFTQFAEWGKLLQPELAKELGGEVLFLYGNTPRPERQATIDRFQNDPEGPRLFILSLKAGGTGLNLTRANHVFHIDRWWNPAVENQATDRAFRIGQKQNVQVHKFVCTGTLEEKISDMLESKKQLAEQAIEAGEQWLTELETEQLRNLLLLDRKAIIDE